MINSYFDFKATCYLVCNDEKSGRSPVIFPMINSIKDIQKFSEELLESRTLYEHCKNTYFLNKNVNTEQFVG